MNAADNKDASLRAMGFIRISLYQGWDYPVGQNETGLQPATDIRYLYQIGAADGKRLYVYAWIEEPGFLLTTERHISALEHLVSELETDDLGLLQRQVERFFQRHGGRGLPVNLPVVYPQSW